MSRQSHPIFTRTVVATRILGQGRFASFDGGLAGVGGPALGVIRTDAEEGDATPVDVLGSSSVVCGSAFDVEDELQVGAGGAAVLKAGGLTVARALEAGVSGQRAEVLLIQS